MSRIELGEKIATGGTGTIYRASIDGRDVATKILHEHLAQDPIVRARFEREASVLTRIRHKNIIRVLDVVQVEDRPAMVMELLVGGDLRGCMMKPAETSRLLLQLSDGLAEIHRRGIVHRDLRPEHILFDDAGRPRIVDFGMASVRDLSGLTRSTVVSARPGFEDPYSWGHGRSLPTQDLYSLGAIAYYVLTGRAPTTRLMAGAQVDDASGSAGLETDLGTDPDLEAVVKALLDAPPHRPRSAVEVMDWLRQKKTPIVRDRTECIHCGATMPKVAPLCLSCGREPLQILLDPAGFSIVLRKVTEKQEVLGPFLAALRMLSARPLGDLKFIIGDARMYSRAEQKSGIRIPVRIADGVHAASVEDLLEVFSGSPKEIRVTAHPAGSIKRFKRGPLISLREGRVIPENTVSLVRTLAKAERPDQPTTKTLGEQCRYAVSLAAATLAADPVTRPLADEDHLTELWRVMQKAIESLESTFALLSGTNLQEAYADLERLDLAGDDPEAAPRRSEAVRARERERIQQLFSNHAETERRAAALEQKIVASCRILEGIDPSRAEDQLREVHQLLS